MIKFCALLILLAVISIQAVSLNSIQSEDPPENEEVELNDNEASLQLQQRWLKKPGGWSKPKPCGRPGKPPCPTEGTTLPPTKPTTKKPTTTTGRFVTPSNDEEPATSSTRRPKPTTEDSKDEDPKDEDPTTLTTRRPKPTTEDSNDEKPTTSTTRRPKPTTEDSRPTFGTTSFTEATHATTAITTTSKTTRRPLPTPNHDGGIIFIDDDDDDPITKPAPTPTTPMTTTTTTVKPRPTPVPKPTPDVDVDGEKDTESTTVTSSTTTQSSSSQECIRKCPVTPEYNPVCGSDGVTYGNPGRLHCVQICGVNVNLVARGPCRSRTTTTPSSTTPVISTTSNFDGNDEPISSTPSNAAIECISKCPITSEYNPVCGSDGVTYNNLGRLNCVYNCGINITVVSLGPCRGTTTSKTPTSSTQTPVIRQCISNCPVTSEYNPVCGSDGFTYTNPGRLDCARDCGVNVQQLARGPCLKISTTTLRPTTTESAAVRDCRRSCPVTPEYSPVCGSNGVTYNNASHLRCAQACKVDVQLVRQMRCPRKIK